MDFIVYSIRKIFLSVFYVILFHNLFLLVFLLSYYWKLCFSSPVSSSTLQYPFGQALPLSQRSHSSGSVDDNNFGSDLHSFLGSWLSFSLFLESQLVSYYFPATFGWIYHTFTILRSFFECLIVFTNNLGLVSLVRLICDLCNLLLYVRNVFNYLCGLMQFFLLSCLMGFDLHFGFNKAF